MSVSALTLLAAQQQGYKACNTFIFGTPQLTQSISEKLSRQN